MLGGSKAATLVATGLVLLAAPAAARRGEASAEAPAPRRFTGLERLYFEPVEDPVRFAGHCGEAVGALLPARRGEDEGGGLPPGDPLDEPTACDDFAATDVPLPLAGPPLVLREVIDFNHPRIHGQYWCLYAAGERTDCWFFSPTPTRTESKLLASLRLDGVSAPDPERLLLRVRGTMVRPMGGWWTRGAELTFAVAAGELRYLYALVPFTLIQPHERAAPLGEPNAQGEVDFEMIMPLPFAAFEELEAVAGADGSPARIVRREVDGITDARLAACGVSDLRETDGSFDDWRRLAACFTAGEEAAVTVRSAADPTFLERRGD